MNIPKKKEETETTKINKLKLKDKDEKGNKNQNNIEIAEFNNNKIESNKGRITHSPDDGRSSERFNQVKHMDTNIENDENEDKSSVIIVQKKVPFENKQNKE